MQLGFAKLAAKCPLQAIDDMIVRMMFIIKKDTVVAVYLVSTGKKQTDYHTNKSKAINHVLSNTSKSSLTSLRETNTKKITEENQACSSCQRHIPKFPRHLYQNKPQKPCTKHKRDFKLFDYSIIISSLCCLKIPIVFLTWCTTVFFHFDGVQLYTTFSMKHQKLFSV